MSADIKQRLNAFADAHAAAARSADQPGREVDLGGISGFTEGRREIGDAFIRHGRPLPTVAQLLDYSRLLARGAERLTAQVAAVGGVHPSDTDLRENGIRPMSISPNAGAAERMQVAEQVLGLVTAAMRIKPGNPADIFRAQGEKS